MSEVGIRALKQNASAVVAEAAAGETVTITDRGRPVAQTTAIPARFSMSPIWWSAAQAVLCDRVHRSRPCHIGQIGHKPRNVMSAVDSIGRYQIAPSGGSFGRMIAWSVLSDLLSSV